MRMSLQNISLDERMSAHGHWLSTSCLHLCAHAVTCVRNCEPAREQVDSILT